MNMGRLLCDSAELQVQRCLKNQVRFVILAQLFTDQTGLLLKWRARGRGTAFPADS